MSHLSMILSGIMMLLMVVYMAPNIFALNRGHILRNMALWLAIFLGLALFYQNFGPDSEHPLFNKPYSMQGMSGDAALKAAVPATEPTKDDKAIKEDKTSPGDFTPPSE